MDMILVCSETAVTLADVYKNDHLHTAAWRDSAKQSLSSACCVTSNLGIGSPRHTFQGLQTHAMAARAFRVGMCSSNAWIRVKKMSMAHGTKMSLEVIAQ